MELCSKVSFTNQPAQDYSNKLCCIQTRLGFKFRIITYFIHIAGSNVTTFWCNKFRKRNKHSWMIWQVEEGVVGG